MLARDPHLGERDPRGEDRQLLLDALCAADEHLVITYCGADARTGAQLPPAVPLGELLDALDATAQTEDGQPVRTGVVVRHPLQPFDQRNFTAGGLGRPGPLSFDAAALAGARAATEERDPEPAFLEQPLPPQVEEMVGLSRLVEFWQHPARGLLRQRLDVATRTWEEEPDDALPVALDALQEWQIGDRLLAARLRGADVETVKAAETARGALPPGRLGVRVLSRVGSRVEALLGASAQARAAEPQTLDVEIELPGHRRLLGTVTGVRGDVLLSVTYSNVRAKQRLKAWIELLALTLAHPGRPWTALVVGRAKDDADPWSLGPVPPADARAALVDLVALRDLGLRAPLPLPPKTGEAYARRRGTGAVKEWCSGFERDGEDDEPEHALCWGRRADVSVLLGWRSLDGALGFPDLVERVWDPLLAVEGRSR